MLKYAIKRRGIRRFASCAQVFRIAPRTVHTETEGAEHQEAVAEQASRRSGQDQEPAPSQSMLKLWRLQEVHFPELLPTLEEKVGDQLT
jgi:hypothetical protein